jgi:hypothetical protein
MTVDEQTDATVGRAARLRQHATSAGKDAGAATQSGRRPASLASIWETRRTARIRCASAGGRLVTSAAEGKHVLAGGADTEALADKVQRVVVLAVPIIRVLVRSARFSRVPFAMIASTTVSVGIAVRTGVRELQVLASLVDYRLEEATGAPSDPALVKKVAIDLYLHRAARPS